MSEPATLDRPLTRVTSTSTTGAFASVTLGLMVSAAFLAGWAPLGFSIVTVFLFAGPHNWIEARYFLARLPARWGKLRGYFLLGLGGVFGLTTCFATLPALVRGWDAASQLAAFAAWNSILILWMVTLIHLRSRQNPKRDWSWTWPASVGLMAAAWLAPQWWGLGLIYLHPLVALWILDRELCRSRPEWRSSYHACLACLPLVLGILWWHLAGAPALPGEDALSLRITSHAGADLLQGISSHLLVATHTFLEMLHYSVWLIAIPLVGLGSAPWRLQRVPLARRSPRWRLAIVGLLLAAASVVLLLWGGFLADYPATRDLYFTVAMLHVLAEVPFLLRVL